MITQWVKKYKDGRQEPTTLDMQSMDLGSPTVSVVMEEIKREIKSSRTELPGVVVPDDLEIYRAIDVVSWTSCASATPHWKHRVVGILYCTKSGATPGQALTSDTNMNLYFALWDINENTWALDESNRRIVNRLVDSGVSADDRVALNKYQDNAWYVNGPMWVVYVEANNKTIMSATTTDDGYTWGNKRVVAISDTTVYNYANTDSRFKYRTSKSGTWKSVSNAKWENGSAYRSSRIGNSVEVTATGNAFFLKTYTSTRYSSASKKYLVGTIDVYIDGKWHRSINCHRMNSGYQTKVRADNPSRCKLNNGKHTIKFVHRSGMFMWIDGIQAMSPSDSEKHLVDAHIRRGGSSSAEALVLVEQEIKVNEQKKAGKPPIWRHYKRLYIYTDKSGNGTHWGTNQIKSALFRSGLGKMESPTGGKISMNKRVVGTFFEDNETMWLLLEVHQAGVGSVGQYHYMYEGYNNEYDAQYWTCEVSRTNPYKASHLDGPVMYSADEDSRGRFVVTVTNLCDRGTARRRVSKIRITPDMRFSGFDFSPPMDLYSVFCAFRIPRENLIETEGIDPRSTVGLLCCDPRGCLFFVEVDLVTRSAGIEDISELTTDWSIDHSADSTTSSLRLNAVVPLDKGSLSEGVKSFVNLLPKNFTDRNTRILRAYSSFDQGSFSYQCPIFTGILGEVNRTLSKENATYSITAFDYGMWLQKMYPPEFVVYANDPPIWSEAASDYYPTLTDDGRTVDQGIRHATTQTVRNNQGQVVKTVQVGFDNDRTDYGSFRIDTNIERIVQTSAGYACSRNYGFGTNRIRGDFWLSGAGVGSSGVIRFMYSINTWASSGSFPTDCAWIEYDFQQKKVFMKRRIHGVTKTLDSAFWPARDGRYRIHISHSWGYTYATLHAIGKSTGWLDAGDWIVGMKGDTYATVHGVNERRKANLSGHAWEKKNCHVKPYRWLAFGYSAPSGYTPEWSLSWDGIHMYEFLDSMRRTFDQYAAEDIVAYGFQGIIPLKRQSENCGDWYSSIILNPRKSLKESLSALAEQNSKQWYFDYDGTFKWQDTWIGGVEAVLNESDLSSISLSLDSSSFTNWVEARDDLNERCNIRESYADQSSILSHGIRFKLKEVNANQIKTTYQAQMIARGEYYKQSDNLETVSCKLAKPLLSIQPRDIVRVMLPSLKEEDTDFNFEDIYFVDKVNLSGDGPTISMSVDLSSRAKAAYSRFASRYGESEGISEYGKY